MAHRTDLLRALPAYLGNKRILASLILALIREALPRDRWSEATFLDPFCGSGAVALCAKAQGLYVIASDLAERAVITACALIANSQVRLRREDVLGLLSGPANPYPRVAAALDPQLFTPAQASFLDRALAQATGRPEPIRSLLQLVLVKLILRLFPMSLPSASDAKHAAAGDYDRVSPRRLGHYLRAERSLTPEALWSVAQDVNAGVFGGRGEWRKGDALDVIASTQANVLYLDPPYAGTTAYAPSYQVLDALLGDDVSAARVPSLEELLAASAHIPLLVLSYGGPSASLDELVTTVERYRCVRKSVSIPYAHLRAIATEASNARSREYLIVAAS